MRASSANGVSAKSSTGVAFELGEPLHRPLAHQLLGARRRDHRRIERAGAVDVVSVPVAEHDRPRGRNAFRGAPQLAAGGERDVRVEDERLAAEIHEARVADGEIGVLRDRREDAVGELLDPQAVRRSRASCSRRRMIGFASFTISSRYTM